MPHECGHDGWVVMFIPSLPTPPDRPRDMPSGRMRLSRSIFQPVMLGRLGEFLDLGDLRIGIGFEEIRRAVGDEAEIDPGT